MQIIFCDSCGLRIPNEHVTAGRVIVHDNKYICENCVPRTEPQRPGMGSSRKIVLLTSSTALPPSNHSPRGSSASLVPQPRASGDKPSGRVPHITATPKKKSIVPLAIGVGLMVLGGIAVIAFGDNDKSKKVIEPPVSGTAPPAKIGAAESAHPKSPGTPVVHPPGPTPTHAVAPATLSPDAEKAADDELAVALRFEGVPADNSDERMKRLEDFIAHHGDSHAATHAQAILSDLRSEAVLKEISNVAARTGPTPAPNATPATVTGENVPISMAPPVAQSSSTSVVDAPTKVKAPNVAGPAQRPAAISAPPPPPSTPEREADAVKEWPALLKLTDAQNFKALDEALIKFKTGQAGTHFLDEHAAELRALAACAKAGVTIDQGMAGWWKFEEGSGRKVADSSGNGNHGAVVGKAAWSHGKYGGAMIFGGRDDAVVIPNSPSLERIQEGEYSISVWALPEDTPSGKDANSRSYYMVAKTGFHEGLAYGRAANFLAYHVLGEDVQGCASSHQFAPGVAHNIVMTVSRKGSKERLYVDGVLEVLRSWDGALSPRDYAQETWKIGNAAPGNKSIAFPFKGMLSDVRLYKRVLMPIEIAVLAKLPFDKIFPKDQPGAAHFVAIDDTTHGNWINVHGGAGHILVNNSSQAPAFAQVIQSNAKLFTWTHSTKDPRALLTLSETDRFVSAWVNDTPITLDVNLTDGHTHRVALYCLDWDDKSRAAKIDVIDAVGGSTLDTRDLSEYSKGKYLVWDLKGHVNFVCRPTSDNFVVSGIFFDQ